MTARNLAVITALSALAWAVVAALVVLLGVMAFVYCCVALGLVFAAGVA